jgi:hypothetical protein
MGSHQDAEEIRGLELENARLRAAISRVLLLAEGGEGDWGQAIDIMIAALRGGREIRDM